MIKSKIKTIGYLRVSKESQDNEKNKSEILLFAHNNNLGEVEFIEEKISGKGSWKTRALFQVIENQKPEDILIVSELSRLGRSMLEIMEILSISIDKGIRIYAIKGDWKLDNTIQSKIVAMAFAIASEIERDLISQRTIEALKARKAKGLPLGRPKGNGKSKLDKHRLEIESLLNNGSTQKFIANRYNTTEANLSNYIRKYDLKNKD